MRCNRYYALFAGALIFAQNANSQQIPPAQQLNPPGKAPAVIQANPIATNSGALGQASAPASAAPAGAPNVITLSQAASSAPASATASAPASASASTPSNIPPIVEYDLANGKSSGKLDAAGPKEPGKKTRPAPALVLQRVSYIDNEPRALIKIHGVLRYFQVGSPLLKKVVSSISAEGVCLNPAEKVGGAKSEKKSAAKGPACAQLISFDSDS